MNLRRTRVQLTAMFTAVVAVVVVALFFLALRWGSDGIERAAERDGDATMTELLLADFGAPDFGFDRAWQINLADEWVNPLGQSGVEPPLLTIASQSFGGATVHTRFEQQGAWLATALQIGDQEFLVVVEDYEPTLGALSSLRWRLGAAALALVAMAGAGARWVAGRSLDPAREAMARQRDFIADAAHELRTPLAVIQTSASQALSREREHREYQRSLSEIQLAAERAGAGVGSLLEMARLEGSAGLGLAIVKTIVDAHHGTVSLTDRAEGGAVATVRLRIAG